MTVVWWVVLLGVMYTRASTGEPMSLKFGGLFFLLLVGGLIWELVLIMFYAMTLVFFVLLFLEANGCINVHPTTNRIEPTAPPESQVMPTAPPESQVLSTTQLPVGQAVESRPGIYPSAVVVPTGFVVARAPGMDVAAVSIDLPIRKVSGWKRV